MPSMGKPHPPKEKEERLRDTILMLTRLKQFGVAATDPGFKELQEKLTAWVHAGGADSFSVELIRQNRRADVVLPRRAGVEPTLLLKVMS
jgi:hypothetical protein